MKWYQWFISKNRTGEVFSCIYPDGIKRGECGRLYEYGEIDGVDQQERITIWQRIVWPLIETGRKLPDSHSALANRVEWPQYEGALGGGFLHFSIDDGYNMRVEVGGQSGAFKKERDRQNTFEVINMLFPESEVILSK